MQVPSKVACQKHTQAAAKPICSACLQSSRCAYAVSCSAPTRRGWATALARHPGHHAHAAHASRMQPPPACQCGLRSPSARVSTGHRLGIATRADLNNTQPRSQLVGGARHAPTPQLSSDAAATVPVPQAQGKHAHACVCSTATPLFCTTTHAIVNAGPKAPPIASSGWCQQQKYGKRIGCCAGFTSRCQHARSGATEVVRAITKAPVIVWGASAATRAARHTAPARSNACAANPATVSCILSMQSVNTAYIGSTEGKGNNRTRPCYVCAADRATCSDAPAKGSCNAAPHTQRPTDCLLPAPQQRCRRAPRRLSYTTHARLCGRCRERAKPAARAAARHASGPHGCRLTVQQPPLNWCRC